eukprot:c20748_g1_i2.p1 GENE.c20748_g1_i2~~c20748_g1_i2.p1  ORF type:complete len:1031 (-),score=387.99 c20748_g1_i2:30-3122(-)
MCSSEPLGMVYIETANLDGETNLKIRQAIPETNDVLTAQPSGADLDEPALEQTALTRFRATLCCEAPNNRLNNFEGYLELPSQKKFSLTAQQLLLRGARLKQTKWAVGCVVFSGYDTKVVRNSSKAPTKRSNIEKKTNQFIVVILSLMILSCIGASIAQVSWADGEMGRAWYLPSKLGAVAFGTTFGTYLILLSTMVPISLYVTLEVVKLVQAFHLAWDLDMYDRETSTFALARTSSLNEELGQVEYIFSDKTGTLTQNLMEFRKCSVGTIVYGKGTTEIGRAAAMRAGRIIEDDDDPNWVKPDPMFNFQDPTLLAHLNDPSHPNSEQVKQFLTLLSVCHTVVPEGSGSSLIYQAASPDEAALVAAGKCLGFIFHTRTPKSIEVNVQGVDQEYQILNVLEFNSDRKRMSVIARNPEGKIFLYTKGADTKIYERLAPNQSAKDVTIQFLEQFAQEGLRTLCCGMREIEEEVWRSWNETYEKASTSLENRKEMMDAAAEEIEKELILVGTTAIEDKLQDGVPDCISTLAKANIKIWVLTGDKQETAINIGFACALLSEEMTLLILNEESSAQSRATLEKRWDEFSKLDKASKERVAIIVDGHTLQYILEDKVMKMSFLELGKKCKAVICCRVTPGQKAEVTTLVKVHDGRICLAIGDGANDVAMIQAAHVGIGISGREGLQAVQSSDYAISQFRFLQKLLLVHGHWNYRRVSRVITFNFYKNICLYMSQFWFGLYTLISGPSLYESWTQSAFNLFFTSLPIMAYGILDQDVCMKGLYTFPEIYEIGQKKALFNAKMFAYWLLNALTHSVICFLIPVFVFISTVSPDGVDRDLYSMGLYTYTAIVYVCTGKVFLMTRTHNIITISALFLSILAWFFWLLVYSFIIIEPSQLTPWKLGYAVLDLPSWWLCTFLVPVAALSRDFLWRASKDNFYPPPIIEAMRINKAGAWDEIAKVRAEQDKKKETAIRENSLLQKKQSAIDFLRTSTAGIGYAFTGAESNTITNEGDWESRLKKVFYIDKKKRVNKKTGSESKK